MNAHWPKHQQYHKEQKERAKQMREGSGPEQTRSLAEAEARRAERTGDEYDKRFAAAMALNAEGDHNAAAKAWRKIIKQWPHWPTPYFNLATVLDRSDRNVESSQMYLKAMELFKEGTEQWAKTAAKAFDLLKHPDCDEEPKPEWWNDEGLKALSARALAVAPDGHMPCIMRARVLSGDAFCEAPWNAGPRTAAAIKEAATWYRRAAMLTPAPSGKLRYDNLARGCDEFADPLLVEQEAEAAAARAAAEAEAAKARAAAEAEAAKARAAAEAEAAEALKVAEAKAAEAAEELLAEEEKAEQQASTKASKTKGKGKKAQGKR